MAVTYQNLATFRMFKHLTSGKYFEQAFSSLKQILLNPTWEEKGKEDIYVLTQHLMGWHLAQQISVTGIQPWR